jgi:hypothetical protein
MEKALGELQAGRVTSQSPGGIKSEYEAERSGAGRQPGGWVAAGGVDLRICRDSGALLGYASQTDEATWSRLGKERIRASGTEYAAAFVRVKDSRCN